MATYSSYKKITNPGFQTVLLQEVFGTVLVLVVEHNGCLTNAVCNATCVQDDQVVVSRQMVDAVIGVYQTMFTK